MIYLSISVIFLLNQGFVEQHEHAAGAAFPGAPYPHSDRPQRFPQQPPPRRRPAVTALDLGRTEQRSDLQR